MDEYQYSISAPARLHLGFLDLGDSLGRRFGSIGLTIDDISTKLLVRPSDNLNVVGDPSGRVLRYAEKFLAKKGVVNGCTIEVIELIPDHSGLGSGTQLALGVGTAISKLFNLDCTSEEIAHMLDRGARSGIGIGAFDDGGFLVDGGRNTNSTVPPIITRLEFPSNWRILLVLDISVKGLHGTDEFSSFSSLPSFDPAISARLCQRVLLQILPAIKEVNINQFNLGIYEVQKELGEYFASAQGGRYTSQSVADAITYIESSGIKGVGQSSWGPTGFAFIDSETQAHSLMRELQSKFSDNPDLYFKIASGKNNGATIEKENIVPVSKANRS